MNFVTVLTNLTLKKIVLFPYMYIKLKDYSTILSAIKKEPIHTHRV